MSKENIDNDEKKVRFYCKSKDASPIKCFEKGKDIGFSNAMKLVKKSRKMETKLIQDRINESYEIGKQEGRKEVSQQEEALENIRRGEKIGEASTIEDFIREYRTVGITSEKLRPFINLDKMRGQDVKDLAVELGIPRTQIARMRINDIRDRLRLDYGYS